jgi:hypothetical protein
VPVTVQSGFIRIEDDSLLGYCHVISCTPLKCQSASVRLEISLKVVIFILTVMRTCYPTLSEFFVSFLFSYALSVMNDAVITNYEL